MPRSRKDKEIFGIGYDDGKDNKPYNAARFSEKEMKNIKKGIHNMKQYNSGFHSGKNSNYWTREGKRKYPKNVF